MEPEGCVRLEMLKTFVLERLDGNLLNVDRGDTDGGDVDRGELGIGGDTLLLLEIDGLEDQSLEMFSLVQAGIVQIFLRSSDICLPVIVNGSSTSRV